MTEKPDVRELADNELTVVAGGWASWGMYVLQASVQKSNNETINQIIQKMG